MTQLTEDTQKYFENLEKEVRKVYAVAEEAKATGQASEATAGGAGDEEGADG